MCKIWGRDGSDAGRWYLSELKQVTRLLRLEWCLLAPSVPRWDLLYLFAWLPTEPTGIWLGWYRHRQQSPQSLGVFCSRGLMTKTPSGYILWRRGYTYNWLKHNGRTQQCTQLYLTVSKTIGVLCHKIIDFRYSFLEEKAQIVVGASGKCWNIYKCILFGYNALIVCFAFGLKYLIIHINIWGTYCNIAKNVLFEFSFATDFYTL